MHPFKINFFLVFFSFILTLITVEPALAGPPFITDDPDPTPYKETELYLFGDTSINKHEKEIAAPALEYDYGIMQNLELGIILSYITLLPKDEKRQRGFGDTELSLKYQFMKETDSLPAMAFAPIYILPTGNHDKDLGNGRGWYTLPIWLQKTCGKWTTYGGGGYSVNSANEMKNFFFGGIVVERELNDKWILGAEVYAQGAEAVDEKGFTVVNLGGYYNFTEKFSLLFSIGNNIGGARNFVSYTGLYWTW